MNVDNLSDVIKKYATKTRKDVYDIEEKLEKLRKLLLDIRSEIKYPEIYYMSFCTCIHGESDRSIWNSKTVCRTD